MAIIRCKMCGGDVDISADKTFGTCECCGNTMTFPKVDDDQRAAAFNRGNHFRRIGEFDKALAVYERIVREDNTDAEAHWCCALCRFGIEYVEDPATYEWLPTCHRASFDSFLEDVDYLAAVEHSDGITRRQYQKDAAKIAEVQRGILATSQNEDPFDVFICYKESDEIGECTRDSLMAQDVYYQLTDQGYRVFFARITLEDMVGKQYEPYIFAALNSAKVMIVIGTKPEYMNAVWVKNEWSRFLAMMKKDRNKLLLPCYRDMDPYDMPEQLSVLQSYDMTKIGFIQDLIRGIKKVLDADKKPEMVHETVVTQQAGANNVALLKRGYMALEDGEWDKADRFFEEVLNQDAECVDAYLGKTLMDVRLHTLEQLPESKKSFGKNTNFQRAVRFAKGDQLVQIKAFLEQNQQFLLRSGNNALKKENWTNAHDFFNEALTIDDKCVEAYIGKGLAEVHYHSLAHMAKMRISASEHAEPAVLPITSESVAMQALQARINAQQSHINEMASRYALSSYLPASRIRSYYEYPQPTLKSAVFVRKQQLAKEPAFWAKISDFNAAAQLLGEDAHNPINEAREQVLAVMQQRLDDSSQADRTFLSEMCAEYDTFVQDVDQKVISEHKVAAQQREAELEPKYLDAIQKLERAQIPAEFHVAKRLLLEISDYKDCMQLIALCKEREDRYNAIKSKRDALSAEEFGLNRELESLPPLFSGRRRKEIEARLEQIEAELEMLK